MSCQILRAEEVKDSNDFLQKLKSILQCQGDEILVTWDVNSLYTSIPHQAGIDVAIGVIRGSNNYSESQILMFEKLFQVILSNNYFLFQDQFSSMGSNVAPPFPCAFMNIFEEKYIYPNDLFKMHCATWWHFIDVFAICRGNVESLKIFDGMLNDCCPEIKFKIHVGGMSVPFLDTRIYINHNMIESDLFTKPTDRNQLLLFDSFHPPNVFKSIVWSQLCGVKCIVSNRAMKEKRFEEMCQRFRERRYPENIISQEIREVQQEEKKVAVGKY